LFPARPDDYGGLAALDEGLRCDALRPIRYRERHAFEAVPVTQFFAGSAGFITSLRRRVPDNGQQVRRIQIFTVVVLQCELETACEMTAPARPLTDGGSGGLFLEADSRQSISVSADAILTGVLIDLVRIIAVDRNSQAGARRFEVVI